MYGVEVKYSYYLLVLSVEWVKEILNKEGGAGVSSRAVVQ